MLNYTRAGLKDTVRSDGVMVPKSNVLDKIIFSMYGGGQETGEYLQPSTLWLFCHGDQFQPVVLEIPLNLMEI